MEAHNVYIDWPYLNEIVKKVSIVAYDGNNNVICTIQSYDRPIEQTVDRGYLEREVRSSYKMHPGRIAKFTNDTLIDLIQGCGKKIRINPSDRDDK